MLSSSLYYSILSRDYARTLADAAKDTTARRETAYFEANIGKVRSVDDLIGNRRLYGS